MNKPPCRAAIIGLGRIASLLEEDSKREKPCTHAGAITANRDCTLVAGCDIDEGRRGLFAERWGVPVYADAAEMIRAQSPHLLVIATHPDSHYRYCRLAADLSVPVVVCEKPLADTLGAARKIANLTLQRGLTARGGNGNLGLTIITNHERRYSADYLKAKKILEGGKLGAILSIRAVLYMGKQRRLLDVLWHDGTHLADVIMFLTDTSLKHRRRWGAKLSASNGTAWLEGEAGQIPVVMEVGAGRDYYNPAPIPVVIEIGAGRDYLVFEIEFSCAKGAMRIGNGVFEVWESAECPYAEKYRSLKLSDVTAGRVFEEGPTGYFANMVSDAVACVTEPGRQPVSSAADGLAVIEYLHSVKAWY